MTPLRITFNLCGPVARTAHPIHLDSLIAHQLVKRRAGQDDTIEDIQKLILKLPLERHAENGEDIWKASSLAFDWNSPAFTQFATRRSTFEEIAQWQTTVMTGRMPNKKIDTSRGIHKNALYSYPLQWARSATGFCVGNEGEIRNLVSEISYIGARRRCGHGIINEVNIIVDERAHDLWRKRYLPYQWDASGILVEGATRLPLFAPEHQTIVRDNHLKLEHFAA